MAKKGGNQLGSWAFLVGLIIAVVVGLFGQLGAAWLIALAVIGLLVGLLNIADSETTPFLMSGVILIIASAFGGDALSRVPYAGAIFDALLVLFVPATVIVAIKNVFTLARN
ncbi:MAG: hypothetical protein AABW83_03565 [Nanoarchaeota archaeon]